MIRAAKSSSGYILCMARCRTSSSLLETGGCHRPILSAVCTCADVRYAKPRHNPRSQRWINIFPGTYQNMMYPGRSLFVSPVGNVPSAGGADWMDTPSMIQGWVRHSVGPGPVPRVQPVGRRLPQPEQVSTLSIPIVSTTCPERVGTTLASALPYVKPKTEPCRR